MSPLKVGYARVSTDEQDLTAQRNGLAAFGVDPKRIYVDHGLTGRNADREGLRQALAACRDGDTFVVTKLDRLARSVRGAHQIADDLAAREVKLSIAGSVYDPTDPMGKLLFNVLAMVAEFEADLIRARTREGMKVAKATGRLRGKSPKLTPPARSSPPPATCCRRAHRGRAGWTVQRGPLHGLPRPSARRARARERLAVGASWTLERGGESPGSTSRTRCPSRA